MKFKIRYFYLYFIKLNFEKLLGKNQTIFMQKFAFSKSTLFAIWQK